MSSIKYYLVVLAMGLFAIFSQRINAQEFESVTYSDTYTDGTPDDFNMPLLSKEYRSSRYASSIKYDRTDIPADINICIETAINIWEACILNHTTFVIDIRYEPIDVDIRTEVYYNRTSEGYIPVALFNEQLSQYATSPNNTIVINSNTIWDCSTGGNGSSDGKNLTFGLLRSIARILGFGSTVALNANNEFYFSLKRDYSLFDKLVVDSNGKRLSEIRLNGGRPSSDLSTYINTSGKSFWLTNGTINYQLANPPYNTELPPFTFLADQGSLMRPTLTKGAQVLQVDQATQDILNAIGWNIKQDNPISIISDDVDDTGLASAYASHIFRIESAGHIISNPIWTLEMPLKDETVQAIVIHDQNGTCTINPLTDTDSYYINVNGDIECILKLTCTIDGVQIASSQFKLYFELKPTFENVLITKIVDNSPYASYDAYYKAYYRGTDKITVSVEEEYSPQRRSWHIGEQNLSEGIVDHITAPFCAWLDFTAENKYGKTIFTIDLGPYGVVEDSYINSFSEVRSSGLNIANNVMEQQSEQFIVYSPTGIELSRIDDLQQISNIGYQGLAIIHHYIGSTCVSTFKQMVK